MEKNIVKEASIFFSDIVGYSSMIARDEEGALQLLDEHDSILEKYIAENNGNVIKHIGDAIFAEFTDSNLAAKTAIQIQNELRERNENIRGIDQIVVRIGLHYGTVVEKGNDLFGNDVNLCARIEPTAIPGGIATSLEFLSNMSNKDIYTRSYGHVRVKNIPTPPELFRIYIDKEDYLTENESDLHKTLIGRGVKIVSKNEKFDSYKTIGILYPDNLGNKKEEFFCYEFLEQMISDLKTIDEIRTSSIFDVKKYKDSDESISQISINLFVQYIAQLSILSVGDKFKVNVLFTSMATGETIITDSWDGKHNELKNISGKIIAQFADKLSVELSDAVKSLFERENKVDNEAYKKYLEGKYLLDVKDSSDSIEKSEKLLKEALRIDDDFAECHATLAMAHNFLGHVEDAEENLEEALDLAENTDNYEALSKIYNNFGIYYKEQKRFQKSIKYFKKGIKLQKSLPNEYMHANLLHNMSFCYGILGDYEKKFNYLNQSQAIYEKLEETIALGNSYGEIANAYKSVSKLDEAIEYYDKAKHIFIAENMNFAFAQALILQSDVYFVTNKYDEAKENLDKASEISKEFDIPQMIARIHFSFAKLYIEQDDPDEALEHLEEALDIFNDLNNKIRASDSLVMMGLMYLKKNKFRKAVKSYKRAKKIIDKIDGEYINNIADLEKAIEIFEH
tara:strand:+ start:4134 stop:6173 length:2040 start_codon:yes stop_codon:yes gene_type:complete